MTQFKKNAQDASQFVLSQEEKIALMEAKIRRAEAHVKALAKLANLHASARGSKYSSHR